MPETKLEVRLLSFTPNALALVYAAFRQCYSAGFAADMWPKLVSGELPREQQAEFVEGVLASGHDSPIEHASFTFAVQGVSRALSHQLVRHRIASYSQQSQRYVDGSRFGHVMPPAVARNATARASFERCMERIGEAYREIKAALEADGQGEKAKEDARFVLPQATETKIVVTMNCRSLYHFFTLRCCGRAQWEIRALAHAMLALCREAVPELFGAAGAACERLGWCPEGERFTCGRYPLKTERPAPKP